MIARHLPLSLTPLNTLLRGINSRWSHHAARPRFTALCWIALALVAVLGPLACPAFAGCGVSGYITDPEEISFNCTISLSDTNGGVVEIGNGGSLRIDPGVTLTIDNGGMLTIDNGGVVEIGNGGSLTIDPGGLLTIDYSGSLTIDYSGSLTIDNGGSLGNHGTLTATNSTITGNINNYDGTITATDSVITGSINNSGALTVTGSTISDATGSAIQAAYGTTYIINSTITGNTGGSGMAGGIEVSGYGTVHVINSTITGNTGDNAAGGIDVMSGGTLTVTNSIVTGNKNGSSEYEDISDATRSSSFSGGSGNVVGNYNTTSATIPASARTLSALGSYGGSTKTFLPLGDNPALCAGLSNLAVDSSNNLLTTDQRGFTVSATNCPSGSIDAGSVQINRLTVNSTADTATGTLASCTGSGGACTLRDALTLANSNYATDGVDINFSVTGTITLGSALPAITGIVSIEGPGATSLIVDGNNSTTVGSIFAVNSGANASLFGLTIAKGQGNTNGGGGGIYNDGTLTVSNSTISGNSATYGGGIYNDGTLTVSNSTISGNSGGDGGSIFNDGTLTMTNSTISRNSADTYGGGICNTRGTVTVTNSTISGNSSPNGAGGGVYNDGTLTLNNSIVAGNTAPSDADLHGTYSGRGNITGTVPALSALQYNGTGATTQTMIPLPGSTAICAGSVALIGNATTDQRGFPRENTTYHGYSPSSPCVDVGAVQTNYTAMAFKAELTDSVINTALATTPTVEVDETNTLTSVVDAVNGIPVTLVFHGGTSGITGTLTETTASGVATFSGLEVNTAGTGYYFTVSQEVINGKTEPALTATSSSFAVTDLTPTVTGISPATGSSAGGTIVVITGTNFTSTSTVAFGGVAATSVTFNSATQITATSPAGSAGPVDVTVTVNAADGPSAASASDTFTYTGIPTTLTASTLSASYTYGAAPTQFDFTLSPAAKDATSNDFAALVDGNTNNIKSIVYASRPGTASVMLLTPFTVGSSHSVRLTFNGSARYAASGSATTNQFIVTAGGFVVNTITDDTPSLATANGLTNCPANSTATGAGSCTLRDALAASAAVGGGNITFDATVFTASGLARNLTANTIYLENPALNLPANTTVTGLTGSVNGVSTNLITVNGNARDSVFTVASGVTGAGIANLTITNGKSYGGGILNQGTLTVTNSTFSGNSSPNGAGGGIYNNSGTLMVSNSTFSSNTAITDGGGIFNYKGTLTVSNSTFADNTANIGGGGIFNDSTLTVTNSTFSGNSATSDGGGIYIARGTLMLANNLIPDAISGRYTDNGGNVTSSANLSELGSYGGATQTLIPLPGSAAICAGTAANATAAGLTTDQRGFARTNTTYPGYASTACVDAGAVQTNYALSFTSEPPSSAYVNTSFGAQVTLAENGAPFADGADSIAIPIAWTAGSATALAAASTNDAIGVATSGVALYTGLYSAAAVNNTLTATLILNPAIPSNTPAIQATSSAVNITSKTTTTSASPASVTYNPAAQNVTLKATVTAAGAVDQGTVTFTVLNGSTPVGAATTSRTVSSGAASVSYALPAGTAAGVYTIQAVYNPAGPFTASSDNTQSLTVGPATATINVTPYSVTYDGSAHTATVTATGVGGVAIPSTGFTLSGTTHTAAGTYATDAWSFSDSTGNYAPASGTVSDKISTAVLTLAANNATKVYGAADPALTYNAIGLIGADTLTGALTRAAGESVGSYAINQGTLTAGANYSLSYTGANFAITAAALTVTANAQSKVYGAADPALTYNATGLIGADTLIGALTRAAGENVGSYAINQGTLTAGANYSLGYTGANFAITAAALTVTPKNVSKMYGSTATLSDYTTTGLLNSDSVSSVALSSSGAAAAAAVGSYAIAAASATGTGLSNYTISYGAGQLTVNTASLTVAAANATRIYGTANPSLSGSITGAVNSDSFTASYTTSATALSDVGSYAIVPAVTGSDLSDYATSLINGTLSVTQAGSTTTLAAKTGTPSVTGESVTLTANVVSTTSGTPTGTITFYGNGTPLCASTLDTTGAASCIATLALGSSNVLTASYGGDTDFAASTSNGISITTVLLDFTLAAPSTTVQTVIPGHAASYKFSITPNYGSYAGTVVFAASGLPAGATVTFSPASIAANSGAQTVTMTIQTAEAAARNSDAGRKWAPLALALLFLPLLGTKKIRRQGRRFSRWLCLLLLLGGMAASATLIGCGGAYFAQAPNDYTITVTATAGSVQHRFNVKLNVQ